MLKGMKNHVTNQVCVDALNSQSQLNLSSPKLYFFVSVTAQLVQYMWKSAILVW